MLTVVTPEEAERIVLENISGNLASEEVDLHKSLGRVVAEDVVSPENLPAFSRSSVDGFAVRAEDTYGCSEALPAILRRDGKILMGENEKRVLLHDCCMEIPTGGKLPDNANAAVMVEYTEDSGDEFKYILKPCAPFENVIREGDDCKKGEVILNKGTVIEPRHIAVLAAVGISKVKVTKALKVGVISTGDELIDYSQTPVGSQVRNINSVMLSSLLNKSGCEAVCYPVIKDEEILLKNTIEKALNECDIVLISGGSSVGERDNVSKVISEFGDIKFHGIALKPGKPTMFAVCGGKPVFGLPGHPAAAFFTYQKFVEPAVLKMNGKKKNSRTVSAVISENIPSNHGRAELLAVSVKDGVAYPLKAKSGMVAFLAKADGYIYIPRDTEGILKGSRVEVTLF